MSFFLVLLLVSKQIRRLVAIPQEAASSHRVGTGVGILEQVRPNRNFSCEPTLNALTRFLQESIRRIFPYDSRLGDSLGMEKPVPLVKITDSPDVVVVVKARKKKKASSRSARRLEDIESRVSKSVHRVSKAVENGVSTYLEKRDSSARKRRDGALVDIYENAAAGFSKALSESSPVLSDFAEALNSRRSRKQIRRVIRAIPLL